MKNFHVMAESGDRDFTDLESAEKYAETTSSEAGNHSQLFENKKLIAGFIGGKKFNLKPEEKSHV